AQGDDASCLNLNRITNPRILGVNYKKLKDRFSFVTSIPELDETDPWNTLSKDLPGDLIPAIADETVIKWGLGMKVGDTLLYQDALGNELKLLLVGGLSPSIFQGNVLISQENFLKHFPSSSGSEAFLIEGVESDTAMILSELSMGMRDLGWSMEYTAKRLSEFNSITNTYLSIFLILGALGLLLGTIGLSIVLFRSIIERKHELALLRAVGFSMRDVKSMVFKEYLVLLLAGTLIGSISSIIATLPSFLSKNADASIEIVLIIIAILLANGIAWIGWMTSLALKNKSLSVALKNE
ncbi:MAG: ABC transporter permease, partial [Bacteroidales bacterium]|nr:ABC transporter permease [Bacteroidales bacterium]